MVFPTLQSALQRWRGASHTREGAGGGRRGMHGNYSPPPVLDTRGLPLRRECSGISALSCCSPRTRTVIFRYSPFLSARPLYHWYHTFRTGYLAQDYVHRRTLAQIAGKTGCFLPSSVRTRSSGLSMTSSVFLLCAATQHMHEIRTAKLPGRPIAIVVIT